MSGGRNTKPKHNSGAHLEDAPLLMELSIPQHFPLRKCNLLLNIGDASADLREVILAAAQFRARLCYCVCAFSLKSEQGHEDKMRSETLFKRSAKRPGSSSTNHDPSRSVWALIS